MPSPLPAEHLPALWTGSIGTSTDSSPTVANGVVYIGSTPTVRLPRSCSGTCSPLWTGVTGGYTWDPTVANKLVYVGLDYFRRTCKGSCAPLGHGNQGTNWTTSPAAANGLVYYGFDSGNNGVAVKAFPKTCSGACAPVWSTGSVSNHMSRGASGGQRGRVLRLH